MNSTIATLIENSVNIENNLNKGLKLTIGEKQFFNEHFKREVIKRMATLSKKEKGKNIFILLKMG